MRKGNKLCDEASRVIHVCSASNLCVHTTIPMISFYTESFLKPMKRFSEQLHFIFSANDTGASLKASERLYTKPLEES